MNESPTGTSIDTGLTQAGSGFDLPMVRRFLKAVPVTGETRPLIDVLKTQLRRYEEYQSGEEPTALAELKLMILASVKLIETKSTHKEN